MFTGIVETIGTLKSLNKNGQNIDFVISSKISNQLKIDQSVAHNGVCMTVIKKTRNTHVVTAVHETLMKTNLNLLNSGDAINLERALKFEQIIDGHLVSGHIDTTAQLLKIEDQKGSYILKFKLESEDRIYLIPKGSVCINGVSLTVINLKKKSFCVSIIPYTWRHTQLQFLKKGDFVNIEFDMLGKYILRAHNLLK
ncbi:MAG: riboflavin synthase [Saprospiraceae bacterium]|nr:riboflavin synthase [Saprospiraceae bacterium]